MIVQTRLRWLFMVMILGLAGTPMVEAQCLGWAYPVTATVRQWACQPVATVPTLGWSFRVDCQDACGNVYVSLPTTSEVAPGACSLVPSHICMPTFEQWNYSSGTWGTTNAFGQKVFNGCSKDFNRFYETAGQCPCAPSCSTGGQGEPNELIKNVESPVVLSLHDGTLELSSPDAPVLFDVDGDGVKERITWTAAGSDEAFLVLDRDQDGVVDDGRELFGNHSPQLPSAEPNGFRALAVFDDPLNGGNGDGWIDALDSIYSHLQLWVDADHDGLTGPGELSTLAENGVEALGIRYSVSQRRDPHGNLLRYQAPVRRTAGPGARVAWDVFFQVLED